MQTPKRQDKSRPHKLLQKLDTFGPIAEVTLNYRNKIDLKYAPRIQGSNDAYKIFQSVWSDKIEYLEECFIMLLNKARKLLGVLKVSQGGVSGTTVDIKIILQAIILSNSSGIVLAHNHPSGSLEPSMPDFDLTIKLLKAAKHMDFVVVDHLIITKEGYYSFRDEGFIE